MIVKVSLLHRPVNTNSFSDITSKTCANVGWSDDGQLEVEFTADLTPAEERAVRRRCLTSNDAEETVTSRAEEAISTLETFLTKPQPTQQEVLDIVRFICRTLIAVIRLVLRSY